MNSRDMAICLRYIVFYRIWFCLWRFLSQCTGDLGKAAVKSCNFYFILGLFLCHNKLLSVLAEHCILGEAIIQCPVHLFQFCG